MLMDMCQTNGQPENLVWCLLTFNTGMVHTCTIFVFENHAHFEGCNLTNVLEHVYCSCQKTFVMVIEYFQCQNNEWNDRRSINIVHHIKVKDLLLFLWIDYLSPIYGSLLAGKCLKVVKCRCLGTQIYTRLCVKCHTKLCMQYLGHHSVLYVSKFRHCGQ